MIAAAWALISWVFWLGWMAIGLAYELFAVRMEKRNGALPLTRVVRDRLMRRSTIIKIVVMAFLAWLLLHFTTPLDW